MIDIILDWAIKIIINIIIYIIIIIITINIGTKSVSNFNYGLFDAKSVLALVRMVAPELFGESGKVVHESIALAPRGAHARPEVLLANELSHHALVRVEGAQVLEVRQLVLELVPCAARLLIFEAACAE